MMAAKVGTGIVAEIGAMRISDEIDALEVMGIDSMLFLCATRLLGAWLVLPFIYLVGDRRRLLRQLPGGGPAGRRGLGGRLLLHLLDVPEPLRPALQRDQGHGHGDRHRAGRLLLRLQRQRRAGRGGTATAKSMVLNLVLVHLIGMLGTQLFWGANPRAPVGGDDMDRDDRDDRIQRRPPSERAREEETLRADDRESPADPGAPLRPGAGARPARRRRAAARAPADERRLARLRRGRAPRRGRRRVPAGTPA